MCWVLMLYANEQVRSWAAYALAVGRMWLTPPAANGEETDAPQYGIEHLTHDDPIVRAWAASALGQQGDRISTLRFSRRQLCSCS